MFVPHSRRFLSSRPSEENTSHDKGVVESMDTSGPFNMVNCINRLLFRSIHTVSAPWWMRRHQADLGWAATMSPLAKST
jgi:hypothetical protein